MIDQQPAIPPAVADLVLVRRNRRHVLESDLVLTLAGEVVMVVLAIRLFLVRRSRTFLLLLWACVCFVIARSSWFTFGLLESLLPSEAARAAVDPWHEYTNFTFQLSFVVLMIAALISFIRERSAAGTSSV